MLTKLLKYDFKFMLRKMIFFYFLLIFSSICVRVSKGFDESVIGGFINKFLLMCFVGVLAATFIYLLIGTWIKFRDSFYMDESYLTNTLPVTKNQLYNSKFIVMVCMLLITCVVALTSVVITFYTKDMKLLINAFVKSNADKFNIDKWSFIILMLMAVVIQAINTTQIGFLGIILGYAHNKSKILSSLVYGVCLYWSCQTVLVVVVYIVGLFNQDVMKLFSQTQISPETIGVRYILLGAIVLYIILIMITSALCKLKLNKGINVD